MKYMLLVHYDEAGFGKFIEHEETVNLTHQLHPVATAAIVRVRDGKKFVTVGPFVETREQIAGYFLIQAKDLDDAVNIAARVPGARIGTVEVRPVKEIAG